jgi:hypothetical protein
MRSDVEKKIEERVAVAFDDIVPPSGVKARREILNGVRALVGALWATKIHAVLPKDRTEITEYFLEAELEQMLNEAVDEGYEMVALIAERAKAEFHRP